MNSEFTVQTANPTEVPETATMAGELLAEIRAAIGTQAFHFDLAEITDRLAVFLARDSGASYARLIPRRPHIS